MDSANSKQHFDYYNNNNSNKLSKPNTLKLKPESDKCNGSERPADKTPADVSEVQDYPLSEDSDIHGLKPVSINLFIARLRTGLHSQ